jgi:hypothetical protein
LFVCVAVFGNRKFIRVSDQDIIALAICSSLNQRYSKAGNHLCIRFYLPDNYQPCAWQSLLLISLPVGSSAGFFYCLIAQNRLAAQTQFSEIA